MTNGEAVTLRATIATFFSDDLAAHQIFALLCPDCHHFCKLCTIHRFEFHKNDLSKAFNISFNRKELKFHVIQIEVLPFIISDKVAKDFEYLLLTFLLDKITEFAFSLILNVSGLPYFADILNDQKDLYHKLFSLVNPINKHHIVLEHYISYMIKLGPMSQCNCMRYDSNHALFKKNSYYVIKLP